MITWMTHMSLFDSAAALETEELATAQRDSEILLNYLLYGDEHPDRDVSIPLVRMWNGYEVALAAYSVACSATLVGRGITTGNSVLEIANTIKMLRVDGDVPFEMPPWIRDTDVLRSHRSNLMRRWPDKYSWTKTPTDMPYIWPFVDGEDYVLRISKAERELISSGARSLNRKIMERIAK